MGDFKQYWRTWLWRDTATKIVTVNFIVWLVLAIVWLCAPGRQVQWIGALALPSNLRALLSRPWTPLTYMFTQADFMHLLVNMLCFLPFGRLLQDMQGGIRTITLYIYGGLVAAIAFLGLDMAMGGMHYSWLIGSSCAVLAIISAVAILYPHFHFNLLLIGPVKLLWVALAAVILFAVGWPDIPTGVAHSAGLLTGVAFALAKKRGIDITSPILHITQYIDVKRVRKATPPPRNAGAFTREDEAEMDRLLAKVNRSGYSSLSPAERQRLFDLSQKIRH